MWESRSSPACFGAACFGASELPALRLRSHKELRLPSNLAVFHMQEEAKESAAKEEEMRTQQAVAALDAALHVGAAGQPGLILRAPRTGWSSSSAAASILDALKLPGSSASLQASRRSRGARSSTAGGRVMLLFGATRRVGVTMYL